MSEEHDSGDEQLEAMLRRWGAEEAATRSQVGAAPRRTAVPARAAPVAPRPPAASGVLRWLPLAAAIVVMALTVGFFVGTRSGRGPARRPQEFGADEDAAGRREVAELTEALSETKDALKEAKGRLAAERDAADKARDELSDALQAAAEEKQAAISARQRAGALEKENEAVEAARATLAERADGLKLAAEQAQAQVRALRQELSDFGNAKAELARLKTVEKRLVAATGSLQQAQKLYEKALAGANEARRELAVLKSRPGLAWRAFRQAYLAAAAPGESGLRALQVAVDRTRMLARCAELRKAARVQAVRRMLDQLEVVLTRLAMLDPGNFEATGSFAALVRSGKFIERIDKALESQVLSAAVRGWMIEAKLILSGVAHVG